MNREQKRSLEKSIKSGKVDIEKVKKVVTEFANDTANSYGIKDGDKVKIDYERIVNDVNYPKMNPDFQKWIDDHKDKVLTVKFDESDRPKLFCSFEECVEEKSPWLVFVGDLTKIDNEN